MQFTARLLPLLVLSALLGGPAEPASAGAYRAGSSSTGAPRPDLSRFFGGADGTFVLLDGATGTTFRYNPDRAARGFSPASTFKIPNTLIALETGVASGPDFALVWDPKAVPRQPWWPASWARDQTLRTALPESVVWYYQELARRIGPERMRDYLRRFDYGNGDMSGGIDHFWLEGGLRISADEQVDFLRRLHEGKLGVSARSMQILKELLVLEKGAGYRLSGKTGSGRTEGIGMAWLVGWVERPGWAVSYYAWNVKGEELWTTWPKARRVEAVRGMLRELGVVPGGAVR
jgi:beta-lactamase class D